MKNEKKIRNFKTPAIIAMAVAAVVALSVILLAVFLPPKALSEEDFDASRPWKKLVKDGLVVVEGDVLVKVDERLYGTLTIPQSIEIIGDEAAMSCTKLASIVFNDSLKTIGKSAFYGCTGLTCDLVIPNSVTELGEFAFYDCAGLKSLKLSNSLNVINQGAFSGCTGLEGDLIIPDSVEEIARHAFYLCHAVKKIDIGKKVFRIGAYAFYSCSAATEVRLHSSVQNIGFCAFYCCSMVENIYFDGTEAQWELINFGDHWDVNIENYAVHYAN